MRIESNYWLAMLAAIARRTVNVTIIMAVQYRFGFERRWGFHYASLAVRYDSHLLRPRR